jgi:hypothetical protein
MRSLKVLRNKMYIQNAKHKEVVQSSVGVLKFYIHLQKCTILFFGLVTQKYYRAVYC